MQEENTLRPNTKGLSDFQNSRPREIFGETANQHEKDKRSPTSDSFPFKVQHRKSKALKTEQKLLSKA